MRVFITFLLLLVFAVPVAAADKDGRTVLYWYDPMVPGQKFDKPGKSPYMDMDLVPFYADPPAVAHKDDRDVIHVDTTFRQAFGVKTAPAHMQDTGQTVRAFGLVAPDTRLEYVVAVRTAGWITDLAANAVGDTVKKGDLLFTFYSPALLSAQVDDRAARRGEKRDGADNRLRLYGIDGKAIAEIKAKDGITDQIPFYAPANGTVTKLNVRKGSYIDPQGSDSATVLTVQDFSTLWIKAYVPIKAMPFMTVGTKATVTVDETGRHLNAVADFIYPMADEESHKGMVRLVVENPAGTLKTGSFVDVVFQTGVRTRLTVPAEAVLYDKDGGHVIEALGQGRFRPVSVKTGITAHGLTEILSGLKEGQSVVTSGQFMIDAESNLRGSLNAMTNDKEPGHAH